MNSLKTWAIGVLAVVVAALGTVVALDHLAPQTFGSASADHYNIEQFFSGLRSKVVVESGSTQTISASLATTTITASQICSGDLIQWAPTTPNASATLDSTANIQNTCLFANGNRVSVRFVNTAATTSFVLAAAANETVYHVNEAATTTAQGLTITSSTPVTLDILMNTISTTSTASSVISVYERKYLTP